MNHAAFHQKDGSAYQLLAEWIGKLDEKNPQTAARMCQAFQTWKRYDAERGALMRAELEKLAAKPGLSRDSSEMVGRMLDA
jgi:aminopeptidase N